MYRKCSQESIGSNSMDFSNSDYSELYSTFYQLSIYYDSDSDTESIVSIEQRFGGTHITEENPILDVKLPNPPKVLTKHLHSLSSVSYHIPWKSEILCDFFQELDLNSHDNSPIKQGINFRAVCRKKKCKSFGEYVFVNFGMCAESNQVCNFAEYMYEAICPVCHSQVTPYDIICVVIKNCAVKIKYKMCSEKRSREIQMFAQNNNNLCVDIIKGIDKYNYIQFTLS